LIFFNFTKNLTTTAMRSFETWNYEEVEEAFNLSPQRSSPLYIDWLNAPSEPEFAPNERHKESLEELRQLLFEEAKNWNEDEMKLFFIGPVMSLINFKTPYFKPFTQRTLTIETPTVSASGKVDFLLAKGKVLPKLPYFCLHEYKQENRRDNDPLGQLLIAMVAAQYKNENKLPVFGTYTSGRNWFFILLEEDKYMLSDAFVASSEDIYQIFAILKKCKTLIMKEMIANV
jgi:hypothetical protein